MSSIYRNGSWKKGGGKVSDRFHEYRIELLLSKQFGLPKPAKPSSKYVSIADLQSIADQLGLRNDLGQRPEFARMSLSELSKALGGKFKTGSHGLRYQIQMSETSGLSVFFDAPGYGKIRDQTFIHGRWDESKTRRIANWAYHAEKAIFECLIPDLVKGQKPEALSPFKVTLDSINVEYPYNECKSDYLATYPKDQLLIEELEGVAKEISLVEKKQSNLEGDIAIAERNLYLAGAIVSVDHPDRERIRRELIQEASERKAREAVLTRQLDSQHRMLTNRRSTLVANLKTDPMRNACLELPSRGTAKENAFKKLEEVIKKADVNDPLKYYAMIDQGKHCRTDSEKAAHLSRTLDQCIANFERSTPDAIHLAAMIYRANWQNPKWTKRTREKHLVKGKQMAEIALQHYMTNRDTTDEQLFKAHLIYGQILKMYSNRQSAWTRLELNQRAKFHEDRARSLR